MQQTYDEELQNQINILIEIALKEDFVFNDITSKLTISNNDISTSKIIAQENGILAGIKIAKQVFESVDKTIKFSTNKIDGRIISKGDILALIEGKTSSILSAERTALNFLQHLCGIATLTNKYVNKVKGLKTAILDTRKTIPGWRYLEKYAVLMGGGNNHRNNLKELILIKDNHIKNAGSITGVLTKVFNEKPAGTKVEIEVETLDEIKECLKFPVDIIMLDNMNIQTLKESVKLINSKCKTEASGGVDLKTVYKIAKCGVDFISIGKITSSAPALDIHLEL